MADLQKLIFEARTHVTDREILATARLNARVKVFAGHELSDDVIDRINEAVAEEVDQPILEGVLPGQPDWLAVIVRRRLYSTSLLRANADAAARAESWPSRARAGIGSRS